MHEDLRAAQAVRFVCSGNMVRSAFAELYARHLGCAIEVDSCATTYRNERLYPQARTALVERGVDLRVCDGFRPRHLDDLPRDGVRRVVLGMTGAHLEAYRLHFGPGDRIRLLGALDGSCESIGDPVLEEVTFESAFEAIERHVRMLVQTLSEG